MQNPLTTPRALLTAALLSLVSTATLAASTPAYRDPDEPIDKRVSDLIARMTLEEKVAQLRSLWL
jgi:beta-glucosidase